MSLYERLQETGKKFLIVTSTHRSGSTVLCHDLIAGGIGHPVEHFQLPMSADELVKLVESEPSEWFSTKVVWRHVDELLASVGEPNLESVFPNPHWVHCTRVDRIAQAVSLARAKQSGEWHRTTDDGSLPLVVGVADIMKTSMILMANEWRWMRYLDGKFSLVVTYEEYVTRRNTVMRLVADHIGVPFWEFEELSLKIMADEYSELAGRQFYDWMKANGRESA